MFIKQSRLLHVPSDVLVNIYAIGSCSFCTGVLFSIIVFWTMRLLRL